MSTHTSDRVDLTWFIMAEISTIVKQHLLHGAQISNSQFVNVMCLNWSIASENSKLYLDIQFVETLPNPEILDYERLSI